LAKYRINPGNVGFKDKKDKQFADIVEMAIRHDKPVRIGVNWGSLDQELLTRLMDENQKNGSPLTAVQVMHEAIVQSALLSAEMAEQIGLARDVTRRIDMRGIDEDPQRVLVHLHVADRGEVPGRVRKHDVLTAGIGPARALLPADRLAGSVVALDTDVVGGATRGRIDQADDYDVVAELDDLA
jgi:hypothetical protein